jgi:succinate dehydrogenase / fumarate reductase, cytochrome b subunit
MADPPKGEGTGLVAPEKKVDNKRGVFAWLSPSGYGIERWAYTFQRLTGLLILAYVIGHLGDTSFFVGGPFGSGPSQASWANDMVATENVLGNLVLCLTVLVVTYHGINGIRLILSEYGLFFKKPSRPVYPYRAKSKGALQRHMIWIAILAAIVAALYASSVMVW